MRDGGAGDGVETAANAAKGSAEACAGATGEGAAGAGDAKNSIGAAAGAAGAGAPWKEVY